VEIQRLTDRSALADYFRNNVPLYLYNLGDLDDFYWPQVSCWGTRSSDRLSNVTMLYRGQGLPVLLALGEYDPGFLIDLQRQLPEDFYAHFSPGLIDFFREGYLIREFGKHNKMILEEPTPIEIGNSANIIQLSEKDLPEIENLYQISYPDNAFDPKMLFTGQYLGMYHQDRLISISGVHVYSETYRVAALGNISTLPEFRGQGIGKTLTSRLCYQLLDTTDHIGLNVRSDNGAAISLYRSLGFRITNDYGEFSLQKRT
jgi:GNAT superfamily N-acetyltransferase